MWGQSQGHHAIDRLDERGARKEEALDGLRGMDEKGPLSVRRTLNLFQRQRFGELLKDGVERI